MTEEKEGKVHDLEINSVKISTTATTKPREDEEEEDGQVDE